jgi:hypothetical protein
MLQSFMHGFNEVEGWRCGLLFLVRGLLGLVCGGLGFGLLLSLLVLLVRLGNASVSCGLLFSDCLHSLRSGCWLLRGVLRVCRNRALE